MRLLKITLLLLCTLPVMGCHSEPTERFDAVEAEVYSDFEAFYNHRCDNPGPYRSKEERLTSVHWWFDLTNVGSAELKDVNVIITYVAEFDDSRRETKQHWPFWVPNEKKIDSHSHNSHPTPKRIDLTGTATIDGKDVVIKATLVPDERKWKFTKEGP